MKPILSLPALMLGAAVFVTPAFAQGAGDANTSADTQARTTAGGADTAQPAADASANAGMNANAGASDNRTAMNGGMSADATGTASAVSSVPDTQKKYKRTSRASDFQKEAETTRQLNQQIASANGIPKTPQ